MTIYDASLLVAAALVITVAAVALFEGALLLARNLFDRMRNRAFVDNAGSKEATESR